MNVSGILAQPAAIYATVGVLAAASALLLFLQRLGFKALERHLLQRQAESGQQIQALADELARISGDLDDLERAGSAASAGQGLRTSMNLSKRAHALRMNRRGDGVEQIAASLAVPRQEVELLLKVHRILVAKL